MNRNVALVSGVLVTAVLLAGCSPSNEENQNEDPLPEETPEAFAEFSGVTLPENPEELEITVERNDADEPRYRVHLAGTENDVDEVCGQVGNYLPHVDREDIDADAAELDAPREEVEATDKDNVHGCSAVIQNRGVDVNALVLKPGEDGTETASLYLSAEPFES